jgi:hypothetical protein
LGAEPIAAARLVLGLSALVFSVGCLALLRSLGLPRAAVWLGTGLAAGASVLWSVENISPDLLVAGLICLAAARLFSPRWLEGPKGPILAGLLWGLAYLTKAVALPLAVGTCAGAAVCWWASRTATFRTVLARLAVTWLGLAVVAAPWIMVISLKYGRLTFSTSARIAHAVAGPSAAERYHPTMRTFHQPSRGRITSWEDPSDLPYQYWSPLASRANLTHQLSVAWANAGTVLGLLGRFDWLWLGPAVSLGSLAVLAWFRRRVFTERWWWPVWPLACLCSIYLPVYLQKVDQRYFYAALPLMLGCAFGFVDWLGRRLEGYAPPITRLGRLLLTVSFALPAALGLAVALQGVPNPASVCGAELAQRLHHAKVSGPLAGSGLIAGGRAGLYVAFWLGEPWLGDSPRGSAEDYRNSGAKLVIVHRRQAVTAELDQSPAFRSLDDRLFSSAQEAEQFPLKAYECLAR